MAERTHFESAFLDLTAPYLPLARKRIEKEGIEAVPRGMEELLLGGAASFDREDAIQGVGNALIYAAIERCVKEHDYSPFCFTQIGGSPEMLWIEGAIDALLRRIMVYTKVNLPFVSVAEQIRTQIITAFFFFAHERAGRRVYEISPGLAVDLLDTKLRGLTTDDLRLPYESIYLAVPRAAGIEVFNEETGDHRVDGIYITEDPVAPLSGPGGRSWRLLVHGASKDPKNPFNDALFHFVMDLPPGKDLDDAITAELKRVAGRGPEGVHPKTVEMYDRHSRPIFEFAMNTVIYATWAGAEIEHVVGNRDARQLLDRIDKLPKNSKKRDDLRERLKGIDPQRRIYLGRSRKLDDAETEREAARREGRPLRIRVRVEGHWKRQFYGEKRALRKRIWVEPYWRGPDTVPTTAAAESKKHRLI